jgi:hypothetical protein
MYNITGKIQKIDLEGGFWAIIDINTQKKYLPDEELPIDFQKNDLLVQLTFEPSAKSSVYQWGRMIHVLDIQKVIE